MSKCGVCLKAVTKRSPAITCSRCESVVHERAECSGLNNKQRAALRAAETLEWVCNDCRLSSTRRTSFLSVIHDEDDEDEIAAPSSAPSGIDLKKLLENITKEVHKVVMRELDQVMKSVQHASDKIDEYEETIAATSEKIKMLERKQTTLRNQCTHLETKVAALEQRLEVNDQAVLGESIEIAGIPAQDKEDVMKIVKKVGDLLQITCDEGTQVRGARRLPARNGKTGAILVQLNSEGCRSQWVAAGRDAKLVVSSVLPSLSGNTTTEAIYIREALTPRTKYLLSKAKRELKEAKNFKFVWCKYGKVFARKSESSKITWIRSDADIQSLAA